ncbi:MAG: hypothetical protein ACLQNE_23160, partial [Thermoguttaceae bacterium]
MESCRHLSRKAAVRRIAAAKRYFAAGALGVAPLGCFAIPCIVSAFFFMSSCIFFMSSFGTVPDEDEDEPPPVSLQPTTNKDNGTSTAHNTRSRFIMSPSYTPKIAGEGSGAHRRTAPK